MDVCHSSLAIDCPCTIVQTFLHFLQEFLPLLHLYGQPRRLGDHRCTWKFLLPRLAMVNHFGKHFTKGVQMLNLVDSPYQPSSKHWLLCPILLDSLFDENTSASGFGEVIYLELLIILNQMLHSCPMLTHRQHSYSQTQLSNSQPASKVWFHSCSESAKL